ncbi:N(G),N(G)-dimethylarginine dimethylaminohydrolase 2 [Nerophis lumbriciformis]|uniref:N(G),N(G)-dimethylarginine dimethylaminohydrolase 2 n=1 Tax=Nerophis lumbriciformis TaxID=546530 RepID=UPI002ADF3FA2|nr:N(G),N(G)-dimethylarginine dimethylaminohydrolase 2-like [Nerophis lumbriciformis]XP_061838793.1 N(G),N(G)-dimethylarginine dimethylaminohydrolase 2-like [Nerophis lumbriciformis]
MANMCPYGLYTHAVVRGIPETFGKVVGDNDENKEVSVDLAKAQRQFGCLTGALRQKVGLQLIEIPADPELPLSWKIEDVAVIQGHTALITRPFREQRRSEAEMVRRMLSELGVIVVDMDDTQGNSEGATLEGSDVLFTGREFFVGISSHTNHRGAEVLADTFKDFSVSIVPVCGGARLKQVCSMGGADTIIFSDSNGAKRTLRMMEQLADHHYNIITVPEQSAANCIYIKGPSKKDFLLHRSADECPDSMSALQKLQDYNFLPTACSEASKLGASLSSLCLLVNKKHTYF